MTWLSSSRAYNPIATNPGPQSIFSGLTLSTAHITAAWPTITGGENSYNCYRINPGGGVQKLNSSPIVPTQTEATSGSPGRAQIYYIDQSLIASTQYQYYFTSVTNGVESQPSPLDVITTLAGSATTATAPTAPTNPSTYIVLPPVTGSLASVPAGNTLWLCTTSGSATGTSGANPGGGTTVTGCGVAYALANTNLAGGDVFALTAGSNFLSTVQGGFPIPAYTGTATTYFVSTQALEYTASGTVPAYSFSTQNGAGTASGYQGNTATGAGNYVGPWIFTAMPTIEANANVNGGYGISIAAGASNIRFIGLNFAPFPQTGGATGTNVQNFYLMIMGGANGVPCNNITVDRCGFGNNSLNYNSNTLGWVYHCLNINCNNCVVHQCYFWGAGDFSGNNNSAGGDAQAIYISGGGPICIQNSYIEGESEGVEVGGAYTNPLYNPHDITYRYNFNTKLVAWLNNTGTAPTIGRAFGESVKNHFELKTGNRVACYGNYHLWNWVGAASQGQGGRSFVIGARDEPESQPGGSPCAVTAITSTTLTATTASPGQWPPAGGNGGYAWLSGVTGTIANQVVRFTGTSAGGGGVILTLAAPLSGTYTSGGTIALMSYLQTTPTVNVTDIDIHDNVIMGVGEAVYVFTGDQSITAYTARVRVQNNMVQSAVFGLTPSQTTTSSTLVGFEITGPCADVTYNQNSIIISNTNGFAANPATLRTLMADGGFYLAAPCTDRVLFTNNLCDGQYALYGANGGTSGSAGWNDNFTNSTWNNNLTTQDTTNLPGTNFKGVPYASIGFADFTNNATQPNPPGDWNITSGTYATASLTGGPLGATFLTGPATDAFPRTRWQVIQPSTSVYASSTFQANAAKFNIVDFGPYMGIEQGMSQNFATIFQNIKNNAAANGITCRLGHYWDSSAQSTAGASGTENSTYTVWTADCNATNWWIRTTGSPNSGWPSGPIISTWGAGNGELAITTPNTVLDSGGDTIYQRICAHFDGVLRLGNAVSQGYSSSVALVANPHLDFYQMDNVFCENRIAGSYDMNTTVYAVNDPTAAAWMQQGQAKQVAAMKAINPNILLMPNANYFSHVSGTFNNKVTLDPSQLGLWDMVYCQVCIGPQGIEQFGTTAQLIADLIATEATIASGGTLIFEQTGQSASSFTSTSQSSWVAADWQACRYGLAICCIRNYHFALNDNENYSPSSPYFMDEYLAQRGKYGWLGTSTGADPPQTAARVQGVWYRVFPGGVVFMNPKGNGSQTITLSSLGLSGLSAIASNGFGDTTINTGAAVTSITLSDRDGRFLIF